MNGLSPEADEVCLEEERVEGERQSGKTCAYVT